MNDNISRNFILNNALAAISAIPLAETTLTTDGIQSNVHVLDADGNAIGCNNTIRPYRVLRINAWNSGYTALGECSDSRMYFLDENFNEIGFLNLESPCENGSCPNSCCGCGSSVNCETTDAMTLCIGSEALILASFLKTAYLFDTNGKKKAKVCIAECGEIITDFISFGEEKYTMATLSCNTQTLTVFDNGESTSAIIPCGFSLRQLIPFEGRVYGLFGQNYIYNRIIEIYSQGKLKLPKENGFLSF